MNKYIFFSAGFNGLYGLYKTYNADVIRTNNENGIKNINKMLIGEKIPVILLHIISGPVKCPINILNLVNYLEIKYRNDDLNIYNLKYIKKPKELFEYYLDF
jgi:hypothetical protein